jgi:type II secretory ATPase GspE/PulE/Tfp pilus assembly ATPase PilB-like protein
MGSERGFDESNRDRIAAVIDVPGFPRSLAVVEPALPHAAVTLFPLDGSELHGIIVEINTLTGFVTYLDSHAKEALLEAKRLGVDRPIVRLVNLILSQTIHRNASDVHIRPGEKSVEVLFRIDGSLVKIREYSKTFLQGIVAGIKVIGRMDVAQHFLPQDGQTRVVERDVVIDIRISIIPTVDGESVVMRLC